MDEEQCSVPFLAHDAVHPSGVGHQIGNDVIVETIASMHLIAACTSRLILTVSISQLPQWMTIKQTKRLQLAKIWLDGRQSRVLESTIFISSEVNDTYRMFSTQKKLGKRQSHT